MALRKSLLIAALAASLLLLLTSHSWLALIGRALVHDEPPVAADAVLVLAGDYDGNRILKGCELARAGFAPFVLVSGPMDLYGMNEADLAIRFAVSKGCETEFLRPFYSHANSTEEEARDFRDWIGSRHPSLRSLLLVTSSYHSARAARIFEKRLQGRLKLTTISAPDRHFTPERWWQTRQGQKAVFLEISKTVANWVGL